MRIRIVVALIGLMVFAGGCIVEDNGYSSGSVVGYAIVARHGFPLVDAGVTLQGVGRATGYTDGRGVFQIGSLRVGKYTASLSTVHPSSGARGYQQDISVGARQETLAFAVEPNWVDWDLFYQLSGLMRPVDPLDPHGAWELEELHRWDKPRGGWIKIYFDTDGVHPDDREPFTEAFLEEMRKWGNRLRGRFSFRTVYDPHDADITVRWEDQGGGAYFASVVHAGALSSVDITIDPYDAEDSVLLALLFARAMGVGFVDDPYSIMYPYWEPGQREYLTAREIDHIRLMYDLPTGVRLARKPEGFAAMPTAEPLMSGEVAGDEVLYVDMFSDDEIAALQAVVAPMSGTRTFEFVVERR